MGINRSLSNDEEARIASHRSALEDVANCAPAPGTGHRTEHDGAVAELERKLDARERSTSPAAVSARRKGSWHSRGTKSQSWWPVVVAAVNRKLPHPHAEEDPHAHLGHHEQNVNSWHAQLDESGFQQLVDGFWQCMAAGSGDTKACEKDGVDFECYYKLHQRIARALGLDEDMSAEEGREVALEGKHRNLLRVSAIPGMLLIFSRLTANCGVLSDFNADIMRGGDNCHAPGRLAHSQLGESLIELAYSWAEDVLRENPEYEKMMAQAHKMVETPISTDPDHPHRYGGILPSGEVVVQVLSVILKNVTTFGEDWKVEAAGGEETFRFEEMEECSDVKEELGCASL